ncbi:MAG TPA: prolyl oligopeptidase family serine peptidase, partial [Burkholderiales bacterium]|nr:prolyl oligopeptidase family serine peptidase [Burkholderiales bacterium]
QEAAQENRKTPILMAHGTQDNVVPYAMGERSAAFLVQQGYDVEWHEYPMQHSVALEELVHVAAWLKKVLA